MLKKILYGFLALIALIVIISLFLPGSAHVERSTTIDAPVERVFAYVNDLEKWDDWSPWSEKDPDMDVSWGEITEGMGASYCWEGDPDQVGKGCLEITEVVENEKIVNKLDFMEQGTAMGSYTFSEADGKTTVTWGFDTDVSSPPVIGKFFGMMMDGFVGPDFEKGLANLKALAEAAPSYSIEIGESNFGPHHFIYVRQVATMENLAQMMAESAGAMTEFAAANGIESVGTPFSQYYSFGEEIDFAFCIPVAEEVTVEDEVVMYAYLDEGACIRGVHLGSYDNLGGSYDEMDRYMSDNALESTGPPMEHYVTDPGEEPDPANWITHIYYPIGS